MYKKSSKNNQGASSGFGVIRLEGGEQNLTDEQKRDNISLRVSYLCGLLNKKEYRHKRDEIGQEIAELNIQRGKLKKRKCAGVEVQNYFMTAAKKILPQFKYREIYNEAIFDLEENLKNQQKP